MERKHLSVCVLVFVATTFWVSVIVVVLLSALPRNPVSLPYVQKLMVKTFVPEGWNFFTRNPREELIYLYKKNQANEWVRDPNSFNGNAVNYYGMKRNARALAAEYGLLFTNNKMQWIACDSTATTCYERDSSFVKVNNQLRYPLLCGQYLFVLKEPLPWAWSSSKTSLPAKYLIINFECI